MTRALAQRVRTTTRGDDGQIMLLSICFAVVCLLLVTVVVSASAVHLERKRLVAVADSLALAAADQVDTDGYFRGELPEPADGAGVHLTDAAVAAAVTRHLGTWPSEALPHGIVVERAGTPDGRTAEVRLRAVARPPLVTWVLAPWGDGITVHARASARAW